MVCLLDHGEVELMSGKRVLWGLKSPSGTLLPGHIDLRRKDVVKQFVTLMNIPVPVHDYTTKTTKIIPEIPITWKKLRQDGWVVVRVEIHEVTRGGS